MLYLIMLSGAITIFAFFFGAVSLWKKGKPLYFQIIVCAIGCYALYQLAVIVMTFCDVNETYFNNSLFGLFGCNVLLFCANHGAVEKILEKPKLKSVAVSIATGVFVFALSVGVGTYYFAGITKFVFCAYLLIQLPACIAAYFCVRHLLSPDDELGLKEGLRYTDIFTLVFCVLCIADVACRKNFGILSGVADVTVSLGLTALSVAAVRGAEKWNF